LTGNYSAYRVEAGGEGAGTVIGYHFAAGGRERDYRLRVEEVDGALVERDELSSFASRWTIAPDGPGSSVTLEGSWDGAGGIAGIFEGLFAPLGLRRIYGKQQPCGRDAAPSRRSVVCLGRSQLDGLSE
jgi:hypothetical protein